MQRIAQIKVAQKQQQIEDEQDELMAHLLRQRYKLQPLPAPNVVLAHFRHTTYGANTKGDLYRKYRAQLQLVKISNGIIRVGRQVYRPADFIWEVFHKKYKKPVPDRYEVRTAGADLRIKKLRVG